MNCDARSIALAVGALFCCAASASPVTSIGSDGDFIPLESGTLLPDDDGHFDFASIIIGEGVTIQANPGDFPIGLELFATGDVHIFGTLDAKGIDLTITTLGTFHLHAGSAFYANNYYIKAGNVVVEGTFNPVPGGNHQITDDVASGAVFFSGAGSADGQIALPPLIWELPPATFLLLEVLPLKVIPLPTSLSLLIPALGALGFARRKAS